MPKGMHTLKKSIILIGMVLFLLACENEKSSVAQFSSRETEIPMEVQKNLSLSYTDSAYKRLTLQAPLAENYPQLDDPQLRFPKGLEVEFYNNLGQLNSSLKADRAVNYPNRKFWEAHGNVVIINQKGERLNTEELFWDEREHKLYSNAFTKITSADKIIMGEGFESDENFQNPVITKVTGEIYLQDE